MNARHVARDGLVLAGLCRLLFSVYLFTFSGRFISDDELYLIDAAESLARRGSNFLTETGGLTWPGESQVEPLQPLLAAPFIWLADRLPFAGVVHTVLLFNPVVTVATAALVYLFVTALDYPRRTALAAALTFGLATIAWPFSKNFFREPLLALVLLATAYMLLRWRQAAISQGVRALPWLAGAILGGVLSLLTKEAALFALPVLALVFGPWAEIQRLPVGQARLIRIAIGLAALAGVAAWFIINKPIFWGLENGLFSDEAVSAFLGHLFSPGKSLFLYSPVFLLAFAGLAVRPGSARRPAGLGWPLLMVLVFTLGYAVGRGEIWWGGTGWGPRYMVPLTPFLVIGATPALDAALRAGASWLTRIGVGVVLALSLLVQVAGVSVFPLDYYAELERSGAGVAWTVGLWNPYYSAILVHLRLIGASLPDFGWARARATGPDWVTAGILIVAALGFLGWLGWAKRRLTTRRTVLVSTLSGLAVAGVVTGVLLWRIYPDRRYRGDDAALQALREHWENAGAELPERALFLNNLTYFDFMLNYLKTPEPFFTMPLSPGDRLAGDTAFPPPTTDPNSIAYEHARSIVDYFPSFYRTAGLVMETGPYHTWIVRSIEWWMAQTYYHIAVYEFGPEARLLTYSTVRAPLPADVPRHAVGARLGQSIVLAGYDVQPEQASYAPGEIVNISMQWVADSPPPADYTASLDVIGPGPTLILQHDSYPLGGFWPTSAFVPGQPVRDNVAFVLPDDLAPGRYEVWALMYDAAVERLPVTDASGEALGDHVLLFTFEVQ